MTWCISLNSESNISLTEFNPIYDHPRLEKTSFSNIQLDNHQFFAWRPLRLLRKNTSLPGWKIVAKLARPNKSEHLMTIKKKWLTISDPDQSPRYPSAPFYLEEVWARYSRSMGFKVIYATCLNQHQDNSQLHA